MHNEHGTGAPLSTGIHWPDLARQPDQLARIAQAAGVEPVVWTGDGDPPDVQAILASGAPHTIPSRTPRLRLFQASSAGMEWLYDHPLWASEVPLASASGVHGVQIGEHVMMLMLALRRSLPEYLQFQRRRLWRHDTIGDEGISIVPREVYGLTIGLLGYGHIGRGVAHLARAFGMRVVAVSYSAERATSLEIPGSGPFVDEPAVPTLDLGPDLLLPPAQLDIMLAQSDVVVVCAPLTDATRGLIDTTALAHVKRGALLINIARGSIVVEDALVAALRDGRLGGAGLDVTDEEPLPPDSPLWTLSGVIVTPHVSGMSDRYVERTVNIFVENLTRLRRGEGPLHVVDRRRGY